MASKKPAAKSSKKPAAKKAVATTSVRHTAVPPTEAAIPAPMRMVTSDMIAARAYEIWSSGQGGSEMENWLRAESELRAA
jgi:hypothetical protein